MWLLAFFLCQCSNDTYCLGLYIVPRGHTLSPCGSPDPHNCLSSSTRRASVARETAAFNTRLYSHVFKRRELPTPTMHLFLKERRELFSPVEDPRAQSEETW